MTAQKAKIRLLIPVSFMDISMQPGQTAYAYIYENGMARLYREPRVQFYPTEFELVINESVYEKLLEQGA